MVPPNPRLNNITPKHFNDKPRIALYIVPDGYPPPHLPTTNTIYVVHKNILICSKTAIKFSLNLRQIKVDKVLVEVKPLFLHLFLAYRKS